MDNPTPPPPLTPQPTNQRHGCLTAWIVIMIIANAATALVTPFSLEGMRQIGLRASPVSVGIVTLCALANVVFAVGLLRWRKWGFFGFVVTSLIALAVNLWVGVGIAQSLVGLVGVAILYGVLNIGKANKGWPQLK